MNIDYNKIFEGFKFNLSWFIGFCGIFPYLQDPQKLVDIKRDDPKGYNSLIEPYLLVYRDLFELAKEQGGLDFIEQISPENLNPPDNSEQGK